jgi:hypothetical protein
VIRIVIAAILAGSTAAHAACLPSAAAVRAEHPGAYPMWTEHMEGHQGERCWFAGHDSARPEPARAVPLPRPREGHREITEGDSLRLLEWYDAQFPSFDERWPK